MAIFAGCAALKLTGRVDSRDTRIGLTGGERRTQNIDKIGKLGAWKMFLKYFKNQETPIPTACLLSFMMDDFCDIKGEPLCQELFDMKGYDILLNYMNNHRNSTLLKKVMNPLLQKLAMLKDKETIKERLLELLAKCEKYKKGCLENLDGDRDQILECYGEIDPFLKHPEFGKFLKQNNCQKIMLGTLMQEYSQKADKLLELGQIVDFGELCSNISDMALSVYTSPGFVSDTDDQTMAVHMLNNACTNWTDDEKILSNALNLADAILKHMPFGTILTDEKSQLELVELLNSQWEKLEDDDHMGKHYESVLKKLDPNYRPKKDARLVQLMEDTQKTLQIPGLTSDENVYLPLVDIGNNKYVLKTAENYTILVESISNVQSTRPDLFTSDYEEDYAEANFKKAHEPVEEFLFTLDDKTLNEWNLKEGTIRKSFNLLEEDPISGLALDQDRKSVWYTVGNNLKLYDVCDQQVVETYSGVTDGHIGAMEMAPNGRDIYLCTADSELVQFSLTEKKVVKNYGRAFASEPLGSMQIIANGWYCMISDRNGNMKCYNLAEGKVGKQEYAGQHGGTVVSYAFSQTTAGSDNSE